MTFVLFEQVIHLRGSTFKKMQKSPSHFCPPSLPVPLPGGNRCYEAIFKLLCVLLVKVSAYMRKWLWLYTHKIIYTYTHIYRYVFIYISFKKHTWQYYSSLLKVNHHLLNAKNIQSFVVGIKK